MFIQLKSRPVLFLNLLVSTGAYLVLAYYIPRTNFAALVTLYFILFGGYLYLVHFPLPVKHILLMAIFFRLVFLGATPHLSDDFYRFIWDGTLINNGQNPFLQLPSYYLTNENQEPLPGLTSELYGNLNSKNYYSLYPPVCQAVFAVANLIGGANLWLNCLVMRFFILLAEVGSFFFLLRFTVLLRLPTAQINWYALNPLVIIELTGNLHPEGLLIFFLLGGLYFLLKNKTIISAGLMGMAVGVKLWPLMFLPLVFKKLSFINVLRYGFWLTLVLLLLFLPFVSLHLVQNIFKSINLYFQQFEFNASIYYVARWLGYQLKGYNLISFIGPLLSLITLTGILLISFRTKILNNHAFIQALLFSFSLYLFFATVVHPWYLTSLVALTTLTRWRYPVVWSGLVFLSYATYKTSSYTENLFLVSLEYAIVFGFLFYEWRILRNSELNKPNID